MQINFNNIYDHSISISEFELRWRFTDEKYDKLPDHHINQLNPLDKAASQFLSYFLKSSELHKDEPFKNGFFQKIDFVNIQEDNEAEIRNWLYQRRLPFEKPVFLSWDEDNSMIIPFEILIKYFDSFYYPAADDLTIFDQSLKWALLFHHADVIYFGTTNDFKTSETI